MAANRVPTPDTRLFANIDYYLNMTSTPHGTTGDEQPVKVHGRSGWKNNARGLVFKGHIINHLQKTNGVEHA
jgi:hypothetical protein